MILTLQSVDVQTSKTVSYTHLDVYKRQVLADVKGALNRRDYEQRGYLYWRL